MNVPNNRGYVGYGTIVVLHNIMKKRTLDFVREPLGWFAVVPEWEGEKWELECVAGADLMLDIFAQGENRVTLTLSTEPTMCYDLYGCGADCSCEGFIQDDAILTYDDASNGGGFYKLEWNNDLNMEGFNLWLCHVTMFVFRCYEDGMPPMLYISK